MSHEIATATPFGWSRSRRWSAIAGTGVAALALVVMLASPAGANPPPPDPVPAQPAPGTVSDAPMVTEPIGTQPPPVDAEDAPAPKADPIEPIAAPDRRVDGPAFVDGQGDRARADVGGADGSDQPGGRTDG